MAIYAARSSVGSTSFPFRCAVTTAANGGASGERAHGDRTSMSCRRCPRIVHDGGTGGGGDRCARRAGRAPAGRACRAVDDRADMNERRHRRSWRGNGGREARADVDQPAMVQTDVLFDRAHAGSTRALSLFCCWRCVASRTEQATSNGEWRSSMMSVRARLDVIWTRKEGVKVMKIISGNIVTTREYGRI